MILVFDTETTGLTLHPDAPVERQPRCIEAAFAGLDPVTGEVLEEHSWLINPGEPLTPEIVKITGLTDADLAGEPPFADVWPEIRAVLARGRMIVAHNLPFDRAILNGELARMDAALWGEGFWPQQELCTVAAFQDEFGRPPRLVALYERVLGRKYPQTHRAADDVRALVEVLQATRAWEDYL